MDIPSVAACRAVAGKLSTVAVGGRPSAVAATAQVFGNPFIVLMVIL